MFKKKKCNWDIDENNIISQLHTQYIPKRAPSVLYYIQKEHCYYYTISIQKRSTISKKEHINTQELSFFIFFENLVSNPRVKLF